MRLFGWRGRRKGQKGLVFKLLLDAEHEGVYVSSHKLGGVDYSGLRRGAPRLIFPEDFRLELNLKRPYTDVVGGPLPIWLVTARVIDVVMSLCSSEEVEVRDVPTFDSRSGEPVSKYFLMNPLAHVECLDMDQSIFVKTRAGKIVGVGEPVLKTLIDKHIFRAAELPWAIFVSADLKKRWVAEGIVGFVYQDCSVISF